MHCITNLDLFNERWPTELPGVPNMGDEIESATTWGGGFKLRLEVVGVRWRHSKGNEWYLEIELHDRNIYRRSIQAFYEWYAPLVGCSVSSFI